jgi:FlaG/FlaF family flagellin (archaellin)
MMKGVSPFISAVILILIVISMGAVIGPWIMRMASELAEGTGETAQQQLICRETAYDFESDYGVNGVYWDFNGTNGTITAKITNTGSQNLYNFSFELTLQTPSGKRLVVYPEVNVTDETQKTRANPLKPGSSLMLEGEIVNINDTWSLVGVKVLNVVCPRASPSIEL